MFDSTSRYYALETAFVTLPNGRTVAYKRRRFLPTDEQMQIVTHVTFADRDRLDLIAARAYGNPEQFWAICDANHCFYPGELEQLGLRLAIPVMRPGINT
jgi:hypothetical protein